MDKVIFEPRLFLRKEIDGNYTITAMTATPNNLFSSMKARVENPLNIETLPNEVSILLPIEYNDIENYQKYEQSIEHSIENISIGQDILFIHAYAILENKYIVGECLKPVEDALPKKGIV